jgi:hypothetical protein
LLCLDNNEEKDKLLSGCEFRYHTKKNLVDESFVIQPKKVELITQKLYENNKSVLEL